MKVTPALPVFTINQFEDYNNCQHCGNTFYVRKFDEHLKDNLFLEKPHSHDFFILLLITNGTGVHHIDFKSYEVRPGSVYFLSPGQVHHWILSEDINGHILFFTREYLMLDFNHNQLLRLPFFYSSINSPCMQLDNNKVVEFSNIFQKIDQEYQFKQRYFHEVIRLNLKMLLIEMEREYKGGKLLPQLMKFQENQFHRFETLIDEHYKEHLPVTFFADKMNISLKQLNTLCKKALNKTPGELLQERIILEAKRLLIHSDYSVGTIGHMLNYTDNSYFNRLFKKLTGTTPEQFRASIEAQ